MNRRSKISATIFSLLFCIFIISSSAYAQPGQGRRPPMLPDSTHIKQMVEELATSLSLSAEQKEKVSELHFSHFKQVKAMIKKDKADREKHRTAMDALRKEFENQVKAELNNKQKTEFEKFIKAHGPRPGGQKPVRK